MTTALWAIAAAIAIVAVALVIAARIIATMRHAPRTLSDDEVRASLAPVVEPLFVWPNHSNQAGRLPREHHGLPASIARHCRRCRESTHA